MKGISDKSKERLERIARLTAIPSPTGFTQDILDRIESKLQDLAVPYQKSAKGGLLVSLPGKDALTHRYLTAHVDTLGAMVRKIKDNGRLKIDLIGGFIFNAIEGENCLIHSLNTGQRYSGTILMHQTSVHVYKDAKTAERNQDNIEIRLDEQVQQAEDVRQLGIEVGDFISFDPRVVITESGFIKSRHLDDKVSVALLLELIEDVQEGRLNLAHSTHFYISNNEEIGYGGNSNIPSEVVEYLAVDMGALGDDQASDEYTVSICAKDGSGPYHVGLRQHLVSLCQEYQIPYQVDIYPYYSSDASAAMRAGHDLRHGLLGAGIEASHAYERTHAKSVDATYQLLFEYLRSPMED